MVAPGRAGGRRVVGTVSVNVGGMRHSNGTQLFDCQQPIHLNSNRRKPQAGVYIAFSSGGITLSIMIMYHMAYRISTVSPTNRLSNFAR